MKTKILLSEWTLMFTVGFHSLNHGPTISAESSQNRKNSLDNSFYGEGETRLNSVPKPYIRQTKRMKT